MSESKTTNPTLHPSEWFRVGWDFDVEPISPNKGEALQPKAGQRVLEEVFETVLHLHLERLTGVPLTPLARAGALSAAEDIVAYDPLDRLHLFELKRTTINETVVGQLSQYLLNHVFADRREFMDSLVLTGGHQLEERMAVYLAGALANERTSVWGFDAAARALGEDFVEVAKQRAWPQNQNQWDTAGSGHAKRIDMKVHTLLAAARTKFPRRPVPTPADLRKCARQLTRALPSDRPPARVRNAKPVVLWLVGTRIADDAKARILEWRARGVDARCLHMDLRPANDRSGWVLQLRREQDLGREALEARVFDWVAEHLPWNRPEIRISLYSETSPSKKAPKVGQVHMPQAVVTRADGKTRVFRAEPVEQGWSVVESEG